LVILEYKFTPELIQIEFQSVNLINLAHNSDQ